MQYDKKEIISQLENQSKALRSWFMEKPAQKMEFAPEGAWSAGQHLLHLIKSTKPLVKGMSYPRLLLRLKFGKVNNPSRSYEETVAFYQQALANGGRAMGEYIPRQVTKEEREVLLKRFDEEMNMLMAQLQKWSEKNLDKTAVPHPLLGNLTMREMLYFTIYHTEHHRKILKSDIRSVRYRAICFLAVCFLFSGCALMRGVFLGYPDHKDIQRFPSSEIAVGEECFEFKADVNSISAKLKVTDWSSGSPYFVTLDQLNESRPVRSMLIIRNDTLLYKFYGQKTSDEDLNPSYSVAKSFTSALIGIAISERKIKSVNDKVVDYIPELKAIPMADKLEVEHLLNMTSGIKLKLKTDAQLYYGNDVLRVLNGVAFEHEPGTFQEYVNLNVQLLGIILHRATGMKPSEYLSEKIWKPINMCTNAIWTTDKNGEDKTFCCMGATALDYAKFGRLFLNNGSWNGTQIVPKEWVEKSVSRDTTNGSSFGYNYNWHIGEKAYGDYMADGMYKQHIYVQPEKNIIVVLMCNKDNALKAERVRWRHVFRQIVDQL